jgi:hypothetical protein
MLENTVELRRLRAGVLVRDADGLVWKLVEAGPTGLWRRVSSPWYSSHVGMHLPLRRVRLARV